MGRRSQYASNFTAVLTVADIWATTLRAGSCAKCAACLSIERMANEKMSDNSARTAIGLNLGSHPIDASVRCAAEFERLREEYFLP